jgi:hypothetical protein
MVVVTCVLMVGCSPCDAKAPVEERNVVSQAIALESAGLILMKPKPWAGQLVREGPIVTTVDGKPALAFPPTREPPILGHDIAGNVYVVDMRHVVTATHVHDVCGCAPENGNAPAYSWYLPLKDPDDYVGLRTVTALNWVKVVPKYARSAQDCRVP